MISAPSLIRFRTGALGRRRATLSDTRLYVYQVISTLTAHDGDIAVTAEYFGINPHQVRAALAYYQAFREDVDADRAFAEQVY